MTLAHAVVRKNIKSVTVPNMFIFTIVASSVVILALAVYSIVLWRRVWKAEQQRQHKLTAQKKHLEDDLIILSNSFLTEQMPWAEGCIRIKVLLDHYDAELGMQPDYQVLHSVYTATQHIPSHEAWRNLSSAEKQPYQQLMAELELQHKQASVHAVKKLLGILQG